MIRAIVSSAVVLLVASALPANMLVNGDFETGDLTGWHEEGPSYYSWMFQASAALPTPAQVYSEEVPATVMEIAYDRRIVRHLRPAALLPELKPAPSPGNEWSMCWTRSGWEHMGYPWISQTFHVAPGKYLAKAVWDVAVWNSVGKGDPEDKWLSGMHQDRWVAAMFMVHVDKDAGSYTLNETAFRKTVWDSESKGRWVHKEVEDLPIETKRGIVEVRLEYLQAKLTPHNVTPQLPFPEYEYVAFDNVYFDLTPIGDVAGGGKEAAR